MRFFIVFLLILVASTSLHASFIDVADSLEKDVPKGGLFSGNLKDNYLKQANQARDALCKSDVSFRQVGAQTIWSEIQSAVKIQKATIERYFEFCKNLTSGNQDLCASEAELKRVYAQIQNCAKERVEERLPVLAEKLGKKKVLSCVSGAPSYGNDIHILNTNLLNLNFSDVQRLQELDVSECKIANKSYNLKSILVYSSMNTCMKNNSAYSSCLSSRCAAEDAKCRTKNRDACFNHTVKVAGDFERENINKCLTEQMLNPSEESVKKTKTSCLKESESAFDLRIREVGYTPSRNNDCYRKETCKRALENAFSTLSEGPVICGSNTYSSPSGSSKGRR